MDSHLIKVLLIDDDEDDYVITNDLLSEIQGGNFELQWVASYDSALEAIGRNEHHVYLLDYHLGEHNGLDLLRKAIRNGCKAPIILLTGQGDHRIDLEAMKAGAADYLVKGQIDAPLLERSIRYAIENARLVEGLEEQVLARTAEIRAEKEKSEAILRSVGDAIVMSDLALKIRYVNAAFSTLTGYTAQEAMERDIGFLFGETISEQDQQSLQLALTQGKAWQGEVTAQRKDGRTYEAEMVITPMHDAENRLEGYVSSHRDISRSKELDQARNQFITSLSHELRTPVTNLKLYTKLMHTTQQPEKIKGYLQALDQQTNRLCDLIQDMLEMATLVSGKAVTAWEPIHLSIVVGSAITRHQSQAATLGLTLTNTLIPPHLPPVRGDAMRLTQALSELIENAVLFTPAGGQVTVEIQALEQENEGWVTIIVRDTGPGISPDEQDKVFKRFFRGSLAESGHIPGTGLGLSKVQEIMRAHGGRVTVASAVGQGTAFTLWLRSDPGQAVL
jgi:two-component system cell cycle sensor histidine kinase/response regulator CckA